MFCDGRVECSESKNTKTKTMAATSTSTMTRGNGIWSHTESAKMSDGSFYKGDLDRFGKRSGKGIWRSPITMYGAYNPQNAKSMFHWTEYEGEWCNDLPNGYGTTRNCCADGTIEVVFEGIWLDGNQELQYWP